MARTNSSAFWACALIDLGIIGLVVFGVWFTHSLWALLGLYFMLRVTSSTKSIETKCPKCDHEFTAVEKDEEDEEE